MSPCLLILEDIETIVTPSTRSYFFNEVDGLENNDGILMLASTNYLDKLDPGLTKRPSRFDRKYLFPLPNEDERKLYAEYWHEKLKKNKKIGFPKSLCPPIAAITEEFSFAYMQEAFVATLLELARRRTDIASVAAALTLSDDKDPEEYQFFRLFKEQVKILRKDMDSSQGMPQVAETPVNFGSQILEPMRASILPMPGSFAHVATSRSDQSMPPVLSTNDTRTEALLSRFDKYTFMNRSAAEFRPFDDNLVYAKRS